MVLLALIAIQIVFQARSIIESRCVSIGAQVVLLHTLLIADMTIDCDSMDSWQLLFYYWRTWHHHVVVLLTSVKNLDLILYQTSYYFHTAH